MTTEEYHTLDQIALKEPWFASRNLKAYLASHPPVDTPEAITEPLKGNRTPSQNAAIHKWLELLADELDKNGHTVQNIVERIKRAEIRPNKTVLKEVLWRPYQIAALGKESTTELTKFEVDKVYEGLNKFISQEFELHVPFPSDPDKGNDLIKAIDKAKNMEYPEDIYQGQETGTF